MPPKKAAKGGGEPDPRADPEMFLKQYKQFCKAINIAPWEQVEAAFSVLIHALAIKVHVTQIVLGTCIFLLRRLLVPLPRLGEVLLHAMTLMVQDTQIELSDCMSLLRRLLVPLPRLGVVPLHALAMMVHET